MKKILVTGGGAPAGINFINSLNDAPEDFEIISSDINKFHLELTPSNTRIILPSCENSNYIEKLNHVIEEFEIDLLHSQPDSEVKVISENREKLNTKIFFPAKKTIEICQNKELSSEIWTKEGILEKNSITINSEKDLEIAANSFGYPYWLRASVGASSKGSSLIQNKQTAFHWIEYWKSRNIDWRFIAQDYFGGRNIAFQSLWKDGELIVSQARERLEYLYPNLAPSGVTNTPVVAVTINDENVNDIAFKSVKSIDKNASGIFCVDLKEDNQGKIRPTEINAGRFFTTSYFFTKAGINMPYYYIKLAFDEEIPKLPKFNALPEGLYWIRHIDGSAVLVKEGEWQNKDFSI